MLQSFDSVSRPSPLQSLPPFTGRGLVHERERCWVPPAHVRLQEDQELHCEYPPWMGKPENRFVKSFYLPNLTITTTTTATTTTTITIVITIMINWCQVWNHTIVINVSNNYYTTNWQRLQFSRGNNYQLMTKSSVRDGTESAVFDPKVAMQHDVFSSAITFGVFVSVRAVSWLGNLITIGNTSSALTKICQNRHLLPRLSWTNQTLTYAASLVTHFLDWWIRAESVVKVLLALAVSRHIRASWNKL